jgi:hypothetical protein
MTHSADPNATDALARRVNERIRALQAKPTGLPRRRAHCLAICASSRSSGASQSSAQGVGCRGRQAQASLQQTTNRLTALDLERARNSGSEAAPCRHLQSGRAGYARTLLDIRGFANSRAPMRATAALMAINEKRSLNIDDAGRVEGQRDALQSARANCGSRKRRGARAGRGSSGRYPRARRSPRRSMHGVTSTRSSRASSTSPHSACGIRGESRCRPLGRNRSPCR